MAECQQIQGVSRLIEFVDNPVIASAKPVFGPAFQTMVRVFTYPRTQIVNLSFDQIAD
jgi:hypothetical protein